jgi:hypothetical protein
MEMMPGELASWILTRIKVLGIPVKSFPTDTDIRRDIRNKFEQFLLGDLWEGLSQQLEVSRLMSELDSRLQFTKTMISQELDSQIKKQLESELCMESYPLILDTVVRKFFENIMGVHGQQFQELTKTHIEQLHMTRK